MRPLIFIFLFAVTAFSQMPAIEPGVSQDLAKWRASQYSNISYKLNLTLEKMSPVLRGSIEIHVTQAAYACAEPNCPPMAIILDWRNIPGHEKESTISNVTINGKSAVSVWSRMVISIGPFNPNKKREPATPKPTPDGAVVYGQDDDHLIFDDGVKMGENVIKLDFTSPILTSGSAITRYVDKEDGAEYIYSLFVPSDASTAFPVFDQPDLKARFWLCAQIPKDWQIVSNSPSVQAFEIDGTHTQERFYCVDSGVDSETKPISTYVFAFAAGPFAKFDGNAAVPAAVPVASGRHEGAGRSLDSQRDAGVTSKIYVRKSQAAKFKPYAAEVFRLNREAVKYLETYFDYKFPWPKYDLVLIPEFPFGGMEHAGATFIREDRVIFPAEPTANDYITRANVIFHEAAHQWFGDCVTMRWFDDLWLKEGFAEFMAYKTLEHVMPEYNAWKVFYERNKQAAYATDSTKGTTAIYQPIKNLSAAKSAYGNIVYRKAPSFLRQAEFYLGEDKFQTAVRAFLKKHEFGNAGWEDLVGEFEGASGKDLQNWASRWVTRRGLTVYSVKWFQSIDSGAYIVQLRSVPEPENGWPEMLRVFAVQSDGSKWQHDNLIMSADFANREGVTHFVGPNQQPRFAFLNYQDHGYGIFLLDDKSRDYVLKNIQNEKDPFLRSMMWGALWDSVREAELDPREYVELVMKTLSGAQARTSVRAVHAVSPTETDETTILSLLSRVSTALNYYLPVPPTALTNGRASATEDLHARFEAMLLDRLQNASTAGQRITYFRAFVNNATTERGRAALKQMLGQSSVPSAAKRPADAVRAGSPHSDVLRTKDRFDIVTRLAVLGDADAPRLLADLEKTETGDDAKRYAYAAHTAFGTGENKAKFLNDFLNNKDISESWIESAIVPFNAISHADLTQPYLTRALAELPNLKRTRKIFFVNDWLAEFIGGQRDQKALDIINKFLADNPNLDNDLRLKILENADLIERAVRIRNKFRLD